MSENKTKPETGGKKSQKRGILIAFAVMLGIIVIWYAWEPVSNAIAPIFAGGKNDDPTSDYMDHIASYRFYPSNYSEDIYADSEYMDKDRMVYYKEGADTIGISDGAYSQYGSCVEMFGRYFDTVINGRYEEYDSYFTDEYFENQKNKERFTPQKLYNITIEHVRTDVFEDGTKSHIYYVSYMIFKNNGTFRNDIGSDMSRTLAYELVEDNNGVVLINYIGR